MWQRQSETLFILESTKYVSWSYQHCCLKRFLNNWKTETLSNVLLFYRKITSIMQQVTFSYIYYYMIKKKDFFYMFVFSSLSHGCLERIHVYASKNKINTLFQWIQIKATMGWIPAGKIVAMLSTLATCS